MAPAPMQDKFADTIDALAEQAEQVANALQVQGRSLSEDEQHTVEVMQTAMRSLKQAAAILRGQMDTSPKDNESAEDPREVLAKQIDALLEEMQSARAKIEVQGRALMPEELRTLDALKASMVLLERATEVLRS